MEASVRQNFLGNFVHNFQGEVHVAFVFQSTGPDRILRIVACEVVLSLQIGS
jgi:hypothetical protein